VKDSVSPFGSETVRFASSRPVTGGVFL